MKRIILASLCLMCLSGLSQMKSPLYNAAGTIVKQETDINLNDTLLTLQDVKSGRATKYKVVSKGLNNNYKVSDGAREYAITFVETPFKVRGTTYPQHMIFQVSDQAVILYYIKK